MAETRALLLSPTSHALVAAFQPQGPAANWIQQMLAAPPAAARLIPEQRRGVLGITTRRSLVETLDTRLEFQTGRPFRLQIDAPVDGWLTLLQWGRSGCYGIELDDGVVSLNAVAAETLLPLRRPYFRENEVGPTRFVFLHSSVPLPPDVLLRLSMSACAPAALDGGALERLAHLASQADAIALTSLDVHFVAEDVGER